MITPMPDTDTLLKQAHGRLLEHWLNHADMAAAEVLALDPGNRRARHLRAVTACRMGRLDTGRADLAGLVAEADEQAGSALLVDLAAAHARAGDETASREVWARAATVEPALAQRPDWWRQVFVSERMFYRYKLVDYETIAHNRHGPGRGSHPELRSLLAAGEPDYHRFVRDLAGHADLFADIPASGDYAADRPFWLNTWLAPLDGMSLMGMIAVHRPRRYVEIGSGMSTKFARLAVNRLGLETRITSVDPQPRNQIDRLADTCVRQPLEQADPAIFTALEAGDILFFDGSHRSFPGSDVTVFFLEILPRLRPGVIVHVHDIYLPDDYPAGHVPRLWNEQYLLACALLYGSDRLRVRFPAWYASTEPAMAAAIADTLRPGALADLYVHGMAFWLEVMPGAPEAAA